MPTKNKFLKSDRKTKGSKTNCNKAIIYTIYVTTKKSYFGQK